MTAQGLYLWFAQQASQLRSKSYDCWVEFYSQGISRLMPAIKRLSFDAAQKCVLYSCPYFLILVSFFHLLTSVTAQTASSPTGGVPSSSSNPSASLAPTLAPSGEPTPTPLA